MNDTHLRRGLTSLEFGYHNIFIRPLQWLALFVVPAVFMAIASIIGLISIYAPFSPTDTMSVGQVAAVVSLGLTGVIAAVVWIVQTSWYMVQTVEHYRTRGTTRTGLTSDVWRTVGVSIAASIATIVASVFFIFPGIFVAYVTALAPVYAARGESFTESFKKSWNATLTNAKISLAPIVIVYLASFVIAALVTLVGPFAVVLAVLLVPFQYGTYVALSHAVSDDEESTEVEADESDGLPSEEEIIADAEDDLTVTPATSVEEQGADDTPTEVITTPAEEKETEVRYSDVFLGTRDGMPVRVPMDSHDNILTRPTVLFVNARKFCGHEGMLIPLRNTTGTGAVPLAALYPDARGVGDYDINNESQTQEFVTFINSFLESFVDAENRGGTKVDRPIYVIGIFRDADTPLDEGVAQLVDRIGRIGRGLGVLLVTNVDTESTRWGHVIDFRESGYGVSEDLGTIDLSNGDGIPEWSKNHALDIIKERIMSEAPFASVTDSDIVTDDVYATPRRIHLVKTLDSDSRDRWAPADHGWSRIAGGTGTGKTVLSRMRIMDLLINNTPENMTIHIVGNDYEYNDIASLPGVKLYSTTEEVVELGENVRKEIIRRAELLHPEYAYVEPKTLQGAINKLTEKSESTGLRSLDDLDDPPRRHVIVVDTDAVDVPMKTMQTFITVCERSNTTKFSGVHIGQKAARYMDDDSIVFTGCRETDSRCLILDGNDLSEVIDKINRVRSS